MSDKRGDGNTQGTAIENFTRCAAAKQPTATCLTVGCRCGIILAKILVMPDDEKATGALK